MSAHSRSVAQREPARRSALPVRSTFAGSFTIDNNGYGAVMPTDNKVTLPDVYNVVRLLLRLGSNFDDIAGLGFYAGKRRLTGPALKAWYEAEREQRVPITAVVDRPKKRERRK